MVSIPPDKNREKLGPHGLEIIELPKKMFPYVDVPSLRTRPIEGTRKTEPPIIGARAAIDNKVARRRVTQEDKDRILEIVKEVFRMPLPVRLSDLMCLSPVAHRLILDLVKQKKISQSPDGVVLQLEKALIDELDETNRLLGLGLDITIAEIAMITTLPRRVVNQVEDIPQTAIQELDNRPIEIFLQDLPMPASYISDGRSGVPKGGLVIPDPADVFLTEHSGSTVSGLITAAESEKIRVIYPVLNNARREESILDEGSQVCSMDLETAQTLGVSWDPDLKIGIQSSNKSTSRTLGLARNVPIDCGNGVVAYAQLHVVKDAAYKVLLGRPFLTVMSAVSANSLDGRHTIMLSDPNTSHRIVIPTYPRGEIPPQFREELEGSFPASKI